MIIPAKRMYHSPLKGEGDLPAKVVDLLFDDRSWHVQHLVVSVGRWFNRRQVLLSPKDIDAADWSLPRLYTHLTKGQLLASPPLQSNPPVSLQRREESARFMAWDAYWAGFYRSTPPTGDPHLRNTRAVTGYHVSGIDSEAGTLDNFIIDDNDWAIRYLVVRIGSRRAGKRVMVEPRWVDAFDWEERGVHIHLPKAEIERCREFDASTIPASP